MKGLPGFLRRQIAGGPAIIPPASVEDHRIQCPYCIAGFAVVHVERRNDAAQIADFREPRRCELCGRYFKLMPRIVGVPLEGDRP